MYSWCTVGFFNLWYVFVYIGFSGNPSLAQTYCQNNPNQKCCQLLSSRQEKNPQGGKQQAISKVQSDSPPSGQQSSNNAPPEKKPVEEESEKPKPAALGEDYDQNEDYDGEDYHENEDFDQDEDYDENEDYDVGESDFENEGKSSFDEEEESEYDPESDYEPFQALIGKKRRLAQAAAGVNGSPQGNKVPIVAVLAGVVVAVALISFGAVFYIRHRNSRELLKQVPFIEKGEGSQVKLKCIVKYAYTPNLPDEMELQVGDLVVFESLSDGNFILI
jgi:hypothetical protein